jgi:putative FmdB family regulatory protein
MPTYEYECDACGHHFEKFQPITSAPIKKCPKCGKSKVRRLISAGAGLLFKGSGFYITDYRPEAYNQSAKADAPASSNGEAKPDAKSDAKPETKSDAKSDSKPAEAPAAKNESKTPQPKAAPPKPPTRSKSAKK